MNVLRSRSILGLLVFLSLAFLPNTILAQDQSREQRIVTLEKGKTVTHDYFATGDQVTIDGEIDDDAYVAGGKIDVNGTINGDLLVVGGQITVRGNVKGNIRGAGGNITILGTVGKNITLAGGNITVEPDAQVAGNAVIAGGNIDILSQVKNLTIAGGNVKISNNVLGDVMARVGNLTINDGTNIQGDISYWSENKADISSDASISGKTIFHQTKDITKAKETSAKAVGIFTDLNIFFTITSFIASLILGLLFIHFFPIYSQKTSALIADKLGSTLLVGLAALIIMPIAGVLFMITFIGFPIGFITFFGYFVLLYISKIFVAMATGSYIAKTAKFKLSFGWTFVIGLVLYYLLGMIPIAGWILKATAMLTGTGAIILQKKYYYDALRTKKLI